MIFIKNCLIISTGFSLIALSSCSPRGSVAQTNYTNPTGSTNITQSNVTPVGVNNQPLYQGSVSSEPLTTTMLPIASGTMGNIDNSATGTIAPQASLKPPVTNTYSNYGNTTETQYTVQAGDTIYSIGRKFSVNPNQIIGRNTLLNPNNLVVGQTFVVPMNNNHTQINASSNAMQSVQKNVPSFPQNTASTNISQNYTVQSGDTLYSIGRKFNIHPTYIINQNPAINPNYLAPGQVLNIMSKNNPNQTSMIKNDITKISAQQSTQQKMPVDNTKNIMGVASKNDNLEKQILSNALSLPVQGAIKENKNLRGVLISAADGDAVKASAAGEVIYVGNLNNYGNMILVRHDNGLVTNYARLKKTFVQKGQQVSKGDLIASAGTSKEFNTSDVLFEVRKGTKAVNPLDYIG